MLRTFVPLLLLVSLAGTCTRDKGPPAPATIPLKIGEHTVHVEIVANDTAREQGLMFRREMAEDHGMLFVFPAREQLAFWMKNTTIPLSIAFMDETGSILNVEDMVPLDTFNRARSAGPALYALEVNQGWFAERGIESGDKAEFTLPGDLVIE